MAIACRRFAAACHLEATDSLGGMPFRLFPFYSVIVTLVLCSTTLPGHLSCRYNHRLVNVDYHSAWTRRPSRRQTDTPTNGTCVLAKSSRLLHCTAFTIWANGHLGRCDRCLCLFTICVCLYVFDQRRRFISIQDVTVQLHFSDNQQNNETLSSILCVFCLL